MKLYGVRIWVQDYDAARCFYAETLGLPLAWDMPEAGAFGVDVGATLIVERADSTDAESAALVGRFVGVSLQVEDIQETWHRLGELGVPFDGPPETQPWGGTLAHFRDPSGNVLTLLG